MAGGQALMAPSGVVLTAASWRSHGCPGSPERLLRGTWIRWAHTKASFLGRFSAARTRAAAIR